MTQKGAWFGGTAWAVSMQFATKLTKPWADFALALLEPWTICLGGATAFLYYVGQGSLLPEASALIQLLLALSSGVLGARVANRMAAISGEGVLIARGRSAVRSLKLLLSNASALEARINVFLRAKGQLSDAAVTERNYEEVVSACRAMQDATASSIENWTDIVPEEANIQSSITLIGDLRSSLDAKQEELQGLERQLKQSSVAATGEVDRLKADIAKKESELIRVRHQLNMANTRLTTDNYWAAKDPNQTKLGQLALMGMAHKADSAQSSMEYMNFLTGAKRKVEASEE